MGTIDDLVPVLKPSRRVVRRGVRSPALARRSSVLLRILEMPGMSGLNPPAHSQPCVNRE